MSHRSGTTPETKLEGEPTPVAVGPQGRAATGGEPFRLRLRRAAARIVRTRTRVARFSEPLVSFTFDDILESACTVGAPILEDADVRGTFYGAGNICKDWAGPPLASSEQYVALHRHGHEIACHTFSHQPVANFGRSSLSEDLGRNRAHFTALDPGIALTNFAYPFNTTSLRAKWQLERHFETCRGGVPGINVGVIDLGFLRAVELADDFIDRDAIRAWITRGIRECGWLIFFSHGIAERPEPWGCHPSLLQFAVEEARGQGARIVPVREALLCAAGGQNAGPKKEPRS